MDRKNSTRLPPLNSLRVFDAVAQQLNFRLAAEQLNVTQGAVAQQIRKLEDDLGVRLFVREAHGVALTDAGRAYLPNIRRAFELIGDATASLRATPARLTISVTPTFAAKWLLSRLPGFVAANPLIDLRILATEQLSSFHADGVDLAIRQGRPPFGPGLEVDFLFPQELIAVCSPSLLAALDAPLTPASLSGQVLLEDSHSLWPAFFEQALGQPHVVGSKRLQFNQTSLAIDAAIAGQGIALASRFLLQAELASGRLVQPFAAELRGNLDFYVVVPRKQRHPEPTEAVRDWLLGEGGQKRSA
ncbi:LysR substrate-binding domain-containing protein [Pseudomonas benzenivorans]|uniref:LysR family transcriptional regulator n=1 Tax=Pseudomonas benzenivorans TaxID=556533 RepID=A0ABY5H9L6_9PSED|nr:LysR substrate-binding domain-containing protein [Pseudomonas benzenivorans]UTW08087.1 LysR family transcriptional regulator [Pseudomonas benzenivorans]